jgi:hypothetical protein
VEVNREVTDEIRQVDILFSASPTPQANQQSLGLLGRIAVGTSLVTVQGGRRAIAKNSPQNLIN